jgi:glycosyltransferase involved in cell wall biosynthesis
MFKLPIVVVKLPSRARGFAARKFRRLAFLLNFFVDNLGRHGWTYAWSASSKQILWPYVKTRSKWLKDRIGYLLRQAKHRATSIVSKGEPLRHGVLFIGYAEGALGLGQAFRANLNAARAAGFPFAVYPFRIGIETRLIGPYMSDRYDLKHAYEVNFIEVACDQVPTVFRSLDPSLLNRSYNILCPYWELPKAPEDWRPYLANIHEIWAPNKFIADAFAHIYDGPIIVMPPAMEETTGNHPPREHYGMDERRFYFMFSFDYYSSPFRKNPLGVLEAFQRAFPVGNENVGLIIKSTGAPDHFPEIKALIENAMQQDPRILMFDRSMERNEMLGLIRASDAYVSLHRAEGFGLGMAEAMTFGRIVIGTDYSGSTDFLSTQTGYPVPYRLRAVEPHEYRWSAGQVWAEPDVGAAADIMRCVANDPSEGLARARAAREWIALNYEPGPVGDAMRERLDTVFGKIGTVAKVHSA